jgi:hypothetical protein
MPESIGLRESPPVTLVKELDESIWQAWKARNALCERQGNTARLNAVQYTSLALLLIASYLWEYVGPYQVAIRFALSVGLVVAGRPGACEGWRCRGLFAITMIFNPVVAILPIDGGWPFLVVFLTILTFGASLMWLEKPSGDSKLRSLHGGSPAKTQRSIVKTDPADLGERGRGTGTGTATSDWGTERSGQMNSVNLQMGARNFGRRLNRGPL